MARHTPEGSASEKAEVERSQAGLRAWVLRAANEGSRLTRVPQPVMLASLSALACSPLVAAAAGENGAAAIAGVGLLSSLSGGVLTGVLASAWDRWHAKGKHPEEPAEDLREDIAHRLQDVLDAGGEDARILRDEIATLLVRIDSVGTMLRTAQNVNSEKLSGDIASVAATVIREFAELRFLVERSRTEILQRLSEDDLRQQLRTASSLEESALFRLVFDAVSAAASGQAGGTARDPRWLTESPYRGLLPFSESDSSVFYGRERLVSELAAHVAALSRHGGVIVVTGASGSGKSSVLRAGLLPALRRGVQVPGSAGWPAVVITPAKDPVLALAAALGVLTGRGTDSVREDLAAVPSRAHLVVHQALLAHAARRTEQSVPPAAGGRLVVVIDQFEEVFDQLEGPDGDAVRATFIAALESAATVAPEPGGAAQAVIVIAVPSGLWDRCARYPLFRDALPGRLVTVGPMTDFELRQAITGPAETAGLRIGPGLVETVLADARQPDGDSSPGVLPLISQALLRTWDNRDRDELTVRGYGVAGGVGGAVAASADEAYESLPPHAREVARQLLRAMTIISAGNHVNLRPARLDELSMAAPGTDGATIRTVLGEFRQRRLVVIDGESVRIAHEALLRAWPRLQAWLADDQAGWILHGKLAEATSAWRTSDKDPSFLYQGTQLAAVRAAAGTWAASPGRFPGLTPAEREFLAASERTASQRARQQRRARRILASALACALALAGFAAVTARNEAKARSAAVASARIAQSEAVAAVSETLDTADPSKAAILAADAYHLAPTAQARVALLDVLTQPDRGILNVGGPGSTGATTVNAVAFSPSGSLLATATDSSVQLWNVTDRKPAGKPLSDPDGDEADAVVFNPAGTLVAATFDGNTARIWDVTTHRETGPVLRANEMSPDALAFSPDGTLLAVVSGSGTMRLWHVGTWQADGAPFRMPGGIQAVAFSPDGRLLATATGNVAQLWHVASHSPAGSPMRSGAGGSASVAFTPNGKVLAVAADAAGAQLWTVATQAKLGRPVANSGVTDLAFSPDGETLATAGTSGPARLWNVYTQDATSAPLAASTSGVNGVAFSRSGLLATGSTDGTARLWDPAIWTERTTLASGPDYSSPIVTFSPGGTWLAIALDLAFNSPRIWNLASTPPPSVPVGIGGADTTDLAFSANGKLLAIAYLDRPPQFWNPATGRTTGTPPDISSADTVAFSPDGRLLATDSGSRVRLWEVASGRPFGRGISTRAGSFPEPVAFSPDGRLLATGGDKGPVQIWDTATQREIGRPLAVGGISALAFSPGGQVLAAADVDGTVRLWKVGPSGHVTGRPPITVGGGAVVSLSFSPDGTEIATASNDGTAQIWDVSTRSLIGSPLPAGNVDAVAFSPDGRTLATSGDIGGALILWDVALPANLVRAACAIGGDSVTGQRRIWDAYVASPSGTEPFSPVCR